MCIVYSLQLTVECPVDDCDETLTTRIALCEHMRECHGFPVENVEREFDDLKEYEASILLNNKLLIILDLVQGIHGHK
jgi:hypothetical protein